MAKAKTKAKAKPPSLKAVLTKYFEPTTTADQADDVLGVYTSKTLTVKDAKDLGAVLRTINIDMLEATTPDFAYKLSTLTNFFNQVENAKVGGAMLEHVLPEMFRLYDEWLPRPSCESSVALEFVRIFALTRTVEGTERVINATERFQDDYSWTQVFPNYQSEHALVGTLLSRLTEDLPTGFCGIIFLDLCNLLGRMKQLEHHPFDTTVGRARLKALLENTNPDELSYAVSAAGAIAFLQSPERQELLTLAQQHSDFSVRIEAEWGQAFRGEESGIRFLVRQCMDVHHTLQAQDYLRELELDQRIPDAVYSPDFSAMAQMSNWLQHPSEYGRVPDDIDLYDKRQLYWPPTKDERTVWLFKYTYKDGKKKDTGVGMVGSITFALFGETNAKMPPEDIYALHCCWELEMNDDKRAPKKRSITAGRKLLKAGRKGK